MIDVVVLAAGRGHRLGALGDVTPKWLLQVNGVTVAERQLEAIDRTQRSSSESIRSISVVVGHAADAIEHFVDRRTKMDIALLSNPRYADLNNWYSLLLAIRAQRSSQQAERTVVFNADLVAPAEWFASFLRECASTNAEALIAVDRDAPLTDEAMKVSVNSGDNTCLAEIGKVGVEAPIGEYVGMFMVRDPARRLLEGRLQSYVGSPIAADRWYEHAIGQTAADGVRWALWPTPSSDWIEIDDEADLDAASMVKL